MYTTFQVCVCGIMIYVFKRVWATLGVAVVAEGGTGG